MLLQKNVLLKDYCNYQIGGPAEYFYEFKSVVDLIECLGEYAEINPELKNIFILGSGTNILFSDKGYRGLVLKNSLMGIEREDLILEAASGILFDELINYAILKHMSGLEWAGGLPGTVGGAVRGNAGAYGGETKDTLVEVKSINIKTFEIKTRTNAECNFTYRQSIFKRGEGEDEIILSAKFKFEYSDMDTIKANTQKNIDHRIDRHPLEYPNVGSIFKNVPVEKVSPQVLEEFAANIKFDPFRVLPVAKLIVSCGLVGKQIGGAQISTKHPNFIVNLGNSSSQDVLDLIDLVKKEVKKKFEIDLEEEVMIV